VHEALGDEQDEGKKQPKTNHRVLPPEAGRAEPAPEIESPDPVDLGEADDDARRARLPGKAILDPLERQQPVLAQMPHRTAGSATVVAIETPPIQITTKRTCQWAITTSSTAFLPPNLKRPASGPRTRECIARPRLDLAQSYRRGGSTHLRWSKHLPYFDIAG
jgi:hypothetical protein